MSSKNRKKGGKKGNPEEMEAIEEKQMFYAKYMSIKSRLGMPLLTPGIEKDKADRAVASERELRK